MIPAEMKRGTKFIRTVNYTIYNVPNRINNISIRNMRLLALPLISTMMWLSNQMKHLMCYSLS